jgi:hypothetical protein
VVALEALVERSRPLPRPSRDEHDRGGHEQHLQDPVVLALVELAVLERGVRMAEPVRRAPDLPQDPRLVPVDDLRPDDAHAFDALDPLGPLEQALDRVRRESRVSMHQQVVGGLRRRELGRGRERQRPRFSPRATTLRPEGLMEDQCAVGRAVVDDHDAQARMRLRGERLQAFAQPAGRVARHEHDEHARCSDGVRG